MNGPWMGLARTRNLWDPIDENRFEVLRKAHPEFWTHAKEMTLMAHAEGVRALHRELGIIQMLTEMPPEDFTNSRLNPISAGTGLIAIGQLGDTRRVGADGANGRGQRQRRRLGGQIGMGRPHNTTTRGTRRGG
jgi:hypothetical protein